MNADPRRSEGVRGSVWTRLVCAGFALSACVRPTLPPGRTAAPDGDGRAAPAVTPANSSASALTKRHLRDGYREMIEGRTLAAIGIFEQAVASAHQAQDKLSEAFAHAFSGFCFAANKRVAEARKSHTRALAIAPSPSRPRALANEGLAQLALEGRQFEAAAAFATSAVATSVRLRDLPSAGVAVELVLRAVPIEAAAARQDLTEAVSPIAGARSTAAVLADLLLRAGTSVAARSPVAARRRFRSALRLAEKAGDDELVAIGLANLGTSEMKRGKVRFAQELLALARERADKSGSDATRVVAYANYAQVLRFSGRLREARALYDEALRAARRLGRESEAGVLISNMARLSEAAGDHARALTSDLEALAIHRRTGPARAVATDLNNLGATYFHLGRQDDAARTYDEARALAEKLGAKDILEAVFLNYGYLQKVRGKTDEARALYVTATRAWRRP